MIKNAKIIVQGITGAAGSFQTKEMLEYGAKIVAGVTPGKGGQEVHGIPVYNKVKTALKDHKATWSVLFVPAQYVKQAALEALKESLNIVIISEHVPVHDAIEIINVARRKRRKVLGPNCPGFTVVGKTKLGIMPNHIFTKGGVGVVSRSGTLTYEVVNQLSQNGFGQTECVGIGGDPVVGTTFTDVLSRFEKDPKTKKIVLIGEIGGTLEEEAAVFIKHMSTPVVAFIAGFHAPKGKRMGHAGAIAGSRGTAREKIKALKKASAHIAKTPFDIVKLLKTKV